MKEASQLYRDIIAEPNHFYETSLTIGENGFLITNSGERIIFGNYSILVDDGSPDKGFQEDYLVSVHTQHSAFSGDAPEIGCAIAGEIDISMILSSGEIPKRARLGLYVRASDGKQKSEWIKQGTYFIDTRKQTQDDAGIELLQLHGYDAMLLTEFTYPDDHKHDYPMLDKDMVRYIADNMKPDKNSQYGINVDARTFEIMNRGYKFGLPIGYSMREVLRMIASAYASNFVITADGELRLVELNGLPENTRVLVNELGYTILFGGDAIIV